MRAVSDTSPEPGRTPAAKIDTAVPHSARIWNYWQGGKDNYLIDRQVGDQIKTTNPHIEDIARAQRYFLARAVLPRKRDSVSSSTSAPVCRPWTTHTRSLSG